MKNAVRYNSSVQTPNSTHVYTPERMARRGEWTAWLLTLVMCLTWMVLVLMEQPVPKSVSFLTFFFLIAALGISLSTWMDRRTYIRLHPEGIDFSNGLRNVQMPFDQVRRVEISRGGWGKKVRVTGERAYFEFRTLAQVKYQGETKGQMGFKDGEEILSILLDAARLHAQEESQSGFLVYTKD